ncbi:MAG: metallophosphoesterase [Oscillospiraceae bacterium]
MAIYTMGDLHLSLSGSKPMDIFGGWQDYVSRITDFWQETVKDGDWVVLAGDISWGMSLEEALIDFKYIDALPGEKIILKGNHDFWWGSITKMEKFFLDNGLKTLHLLHNNCVAAEDKIICGTRGWMVESDGEPDKKITLREEGRLRTSILSAGNSNLEKIVFLHYPPVYGNRESGKMVEIMQEFHISRCFYGHVHGKAHEKAINGGYKGLELALVSADFLKFKLRLV